jgi:hypothetical protein
MMDSLGQTLEIANLKALYCKSADACADDPEGGRKAFDAIFTGDVTADYGYGLLTGLGEITEFLCTAIAGNSLWMIHMLTSPSTAVEGDSASAEWAVQVNSKRRDTGAIDIVVGRYADEFRRTPEGWRIAKIVFRQLP